MDSTYIESDKIHHEKDIEKTKIIRLFQTFSRKELQEIDHFLQSFFSTSHIALKIFDYLRPLAPGFKGIGDGLKLGNIYEQVYDRLPESKKEIVNLQNSISDLYACLLRFLVWKETEVSSHEVELLKLKALKKRGLRKDYLSHIQRVSKRMERKPNKDFWYSIQQLQLKDQFYYSTDIEEIGQDSNMVKEAMDCLDDFFITAKLKYGAELKGRMKALQENHEIFLLEEVLQGFENRKYEENELAGLYSNVLKLLETGEREVFLILKKQIERNTFLDKGELFVLWIGLINYTARLQKTGDASAIQLSFDLYKFGIKKEIFTSTGYFAEEIFLGFVNIGGYLGAYGELTQFIQKWGQTLNPKNREAILRLINANINFGKGKFDLALALCNKLKLQKETYQIQCFLIELKSLFELRADYQKKIYRKCDQFERFLLKNKKLGKAYIEGGLNFLMIYKLLFNSKNKEAIEDKFKLKHSLIAKEWLMAKAKSL